MNPREFFARRKGFYELENYRQEREWERMRWQTIYLMNTAGKVMQKNLTFSDFPFPWEESTVVLRPLTEDRKKKLKELSRQLFDKEVIETKIMTAEDLKMFQN
jgi:hypothetical protein